MAAGTETETAALAEALEHATPSVFSDYAKIGLLGELWQQVRGNTASDSRVRLFVVLTAKYLVVAPDVPDSSDPGISARGIANYAAWIAGLERARAALRSALPADLANQLRARVTDLANRRALTAEQLGQLNRFVSAISSQ